MHNKSRFGNVLIYECPSFPTPLSVIILSNKSARGRCTQYYSRLINGLIRPALIAILLPGCTVVTGRWTSIDGSLYQGRRFYC